jgi:hypothetical protein
VEAGGTTLAASALLSLGRTSLELLFRLCVLLGELSLLCGALAFLPDDVVHLPRRGGVSPGFLPVPRCLAREAHALLATALGRSPHGNPDEGDHDERPDDQRMCRSAR